MQKSCQIRQNIMVNAIFLPFLAIPMANAIFLPFVAILMANAKFLPFTAKNVADCQTHATFAIQTTQ